MLRILAALLLMFAVGCASGNPPREDQAPAAGSSDVELEPIGGGQKVCGWSDTGRWVCEDKGGKKKKSSKFSTKFKNKAPPPEQESKLPRGDTPVILDPIDEEGDGATSKKDDIGGG